MRLEATVGVRRGSLDLDVELELDAGVTLAVLGPNGAGKSTLIRTLAGLVPLQRGAIRLDGLVMADARAGVHLPPEARAVGLVFQDYVLFPNMSVLDNVAFGPRSRGAGRVEAARRARGELEELEALDLAPRRPSQLSAGEAQLVALARALAGSPTMLLLDEPTAALDVTTRALVRAQLRRRLAAFAGVRIVVTHDPVEALSLATRLMVIEQGRVVQSGSPSEIAARPRSPYVADLVGVNLFRGVAHGSHVELEGGGALVVAGEHNGRVLTVAHPRAVALYLEPPTGSPRNVWRARVESVEPMADRVRVRLSGAPGVVAELTEGGAAQLGLGEGHVVWASIKATELGVYPDD